jgi:hypothetical protein
MKPTKIAFTKKYFPEQYHGEDYFIEYILEEGDTLCNAFKKAKEDTLECFKNNNPQIKWHNEVKQMNNAFNQNGIIKSEPPTEKINKGTIEEQIQAFNGTVEELKREWYYIAMMNKKATTAYNEKLSELESKLKTNKQEPTY